MSEYTSLDTITVSLTAEHDAISDNVYNGNRDNVNQSDHCKANEPSTRPKSPNATHESDSPDINLPQLDGAAPHRGSFVDHLPHGHTLPQPIMSENLVAGSNSTPEARRQNLYCSQHDGEVLTDSDHDRGSTALEENLTSFPNEQSRDVDTGMSLGSPTFAVAFGIPSPPPLDTKPGRRQTKQYTLSNGAVVSGKGLGRGRPGVKRGPRNTRDEVGELVLHSEDAGKVPSRFETTDVRGQKRKRNTNGAEAESALGSTTTDSRESSVEYQPTATQTRFGRQTQRPSGVSAGTTTPSLKAGVAKNSPSQASPSVTPRTHPKIKRRVYRGKEQNALCEHCLRGHGPQSNVIVFCDACNKCWHQRCHEPQISKATIADVKAEWFCSECDQLLNKGRKGRKTGEPVTSRVMAPAPVPEPPTYIYAGPRVGGRFLSPAQKSAYLATLSNDRLISLLLDASQLAPDLPMFETLVPTQPLTAPQAHFTSTYVTPVTQEPQAGATNSSNGDNAEDEGYDGYFDEHAALYPKPGFGVKLPPESEDLHMLLEGRDSTTFSHRVWGMVGENHNGAGNRR